MVWSLASVGHWSWARIGERIVPLVYGFSRERRGVLPLSAALRSWARARFPAGSRFSGHSRFSGERPRWLWGMFRSRGLWAELLPLALCPSLLSLSLFPLSLPSLLLLTPLSLPLCLSLFLLSLSSLSIQVKNALLAWHISIYCIVCVAKAFQKTLHCT